MKLKRRALSVMLTMALVFTFMPLLTQPADAASKVQLIKSSKSNDGGTFTEYSYNDKGLVKKAVTSSVSKDEDIDIVTVVTSTFKYNKKNKITKETTKRVVTETYYDTNKTTEKNNGVKLGTVTTTTTSVTDYTYKKGLAKQAVTTSTTVKSGSVTETSKSRGIGGTELVDGKIIAGYNKFKPDGTRYTKDTSENAYYYTGAVDTVAADVKKVTTYTDNGNGTYSESTENTRVYSNVDLEYVYGDDQITVKEVKVTPRANSTSTYYDKSTETFLNKSVQTTNYTNKKKLLSKAETTVVDTYERTSGQGIVKNTHANGYSYEMVDNQVDKTVSTNTDAYTTTYSYKNGRAEKSTVSTPGVETHNVTSTEGLPNFTVTDKYPDGSTDTCTATGKGADCVSYTTDVAANGTQTITYKENSYTVEYSDGSTPSVVEGSDAVVTTKTLKAVPWKNTTNFKYDKKGNLKNTKMKGSDTRIKLKKNETFGNTIYEFGTDKTAQAAEVAVTTESKASTKYDNTVQKGTKRLKRKVSMTKSSYGRSTDKVYDLTRTSYKFKAKNVPSKSAKAVEAQQWIIQNGLLNGVAGL
jgi:hypothetical protein